MAKNTELNKKENDSPLPKIIVTGANGQLGKEIRMLATAYPAYQFVFLSREDLPIHDFETIRNFFEITKPQFCINCAAYTAVDKAEEEKDQAFQINAEAVGVLAAVCKKYAAQFIHISTDYVFDGTAAAPYKENDVANPVNTYGATKLKGEQEALQYNPSSIIIRTSWVYSEFGKNFVKTMMKLMSEREELKVVNDQVGSPTYAADLAEAILQIISASQAPGNNWHPGIYHFSNNGIISWYDFAVAIKKISGSKCNILPIPSSNFPTPAKRPSYSVFDKEKIQSAFGISLKDWGDSLSICIEKIKQHQSK
jgi:dTDP-4-dehydrorhamnose reductase